LNSIVYHLKIAYRVTNSFSSFLHSTFALPLSLLYLALEDGSPYKHKSKGLMLIIPTNLNSLYFYN